MYPLTDVQVTALTIKIEAYLGPLPIPFKFPQPNACQDQGLTCPLAAGSDDTFKSQLLIPSEATAGVSVIACIVRHYYTTM